MFLRLFLKSNHFTESQEEGKIGSLLLWYTSSVKPHRDPHFLFWLQTCFILQEVAVRCVVRYIPIHSSCLRISTLSAISRSTRGEEVCYSLRQEFHLGRMFLFWCAIILFNVLPKTSPKTTSDPKVFMVSRLRRDQSPSCTGHCIKSSWFAQYGCLIVLVEFTL